MAGMYNNIKNTRRIDVSIAYTIIGNQYFYFYIDLTNVFIFVIKKLTKL